MHGQSRKKILSYTSSLNVWTVATSECFGRRVSAERFGRPGADGFSVRVPHRIGEVLFRSPTESGLLCYEA